jgi:hypothetical protein
VLVQLFCRIAVKRAFCSVHQLDFHVIFLICGQRVFNASLMVGFDFSAKNYPFNLFVSPTNLTGMSYFFALKNLIKVIKFTMLSFVPFISLLHAL